MDIKANETVELELEIAISDIAYYNIICKDWIVEPGEYDVYVGASSQDIRLQDRVVISDNVPYTISQSRESMMG